MQTQVFTLIIFAFFLSFSSQAYSAEKNQPDKGKIIFLNDYEKDWKNVDSLINIGLPKSALEIVDKIYIKAKNENNAPNFIRAIMYKIKLQTETREEDFVAAIKDIKNEMEISSFPVKPVLQSMLAEMYWSYYQTNRYKIYQRSKTENFKEDDIRTWDMYKIVDEVIFYYKASVEDARNLQSINISSFEDILNYYYVDKNIPNGRELRPTLYDFLAHRAVDFFISSEPALTRPAEQFILNDEIYFGNAEDFAKLNITTKDIYSFRYYATILLQDVIKFHLNEANPASLIDADLKRLAFVYSNSGNENKEKFYLNSLENLENKYSNDPVVTFILYYEANLIYGRSARYNPLESENFKWDAKSAYDICEKGIQKFPDSKGADNLRSLQSAIKTKSLEIRSENVNLPGQPFKSYIKYKNLHTLYFRLIKTNEDELKDIYEKYSKDYNTNFNEKLIEYFRDKSAEKQFTVNLPDDGDYQSHSVESKMPELPKGLYIILAGTDNSLSFNKEAVSFTITTISRISYMNRTGTDGTVDFYLLDRESGHPLKNTSATMFIEKYDYSKSVYEYLEGKTYTTNNEGYFSIPPTKEYRRFYLIIENGDDRLNTSFTGNALNYSYSYYYLNMFYQGEYYDYNNENREKYVWVTFFTDRAIYRPGQTIYFKGILLETYKGKTEIKTNFSTNVYLYNPNYQKSGELQLKTNEYGTFSGSFTAPSTGLNGRYTIQTEFYTGYAYIQVEDYKRPKFEVNFNPVLGSFKLGEKVTMSGKAKAYSGSNIDNANVKFRVIRKVVFPDWWYYWRGFTQSVETEISNGVAGTNDTGYFEISFTALPDLTVSKESDPYYTYSVYADVTDLNGETRSGENHINIGYKSLKISIDIPNIVDKNDKDEFKLSTTNLDGQKEPVEGTINIYRLKNPSIAYRKRFWEVPDKFLYTENEFHKYFPKDEYKDENNIQKWEKDFKVSEIKFNTISDSTLKLIGLSEWNQGMYLIESSAKDKFGEEVKELNYFTVFSTGEKTLPYPSTNWFNPVKYLVEPGDNASLLAGSSDRNVDMLYEIEQNGKILDKKWININNEQIYLTVPIIEDYRGNIAVHMSYIKDNRFYSNDEIITVPFTNKMLDITFETFRNKLQPGENEEWRIRIAGKNGDKVAAEMVATLYDASLDAFAKNSWNFSIYESYYSKLKWMSEGDFAANDYAIYTLYWNIDAYYTHYTFDRLNWFGVPYISYYGGYYDYDEGIPTMNQAPVMLEKRTSDRSGRLKLDGVEEEKSKDYEKKEAPKSKDKGDITTETLKDGKGPHEETTEKPEKITGVTARRDFDETAFFYPDLETDANGEVIIKFKVPEALTKWNMLGFAHTKDLKFGLVKNELITQKELMVVPNAPRFFREGDKITFSTKITNLSEKDLTGNTQLELYDAFTMVQIDNLLKNNEPVKSFEIKKGLSTSLNWDLSIPEGIEAVLYRVVAKADNFSDGEEIVVPVLTNRMLVTETMPLPIRSKETKHFTMDKLVNNKSTTLSNYKLSLEFTSNPAWYAIQALPYLMEYPYECAEQVFSRYYANSIATFIANSNPKIKQVFDTWRNFQPDALLSNLEKNQELKTLMLEETPWVREAKNESDRKRRVGVLFEINRMSNELQKALNKLSKMQVSSGAWTWFEGMPEDRWMTQHIVTGLGQLDHLGIDKISKNETLKTMVEKALYYLDNQMNNDYEELKKLEKEGKIKLSDNHLWSTEIHYLYARSFFREIPVPENCKEGYEYFIGQAKKYWNDYDKYFQGMLALSLYRNGDQNTPEKIVNSLRERSIVSEEMGMYWKENTWGYYWYQAPIETQSLLIEVFSEVAKDQKAVDDMKVWLLKNKQTQDWKTTKATVEACYALLLEGTDWLANTDMVEITLGNMKIEPSKMENVKVEAGTGYFKTSWSGSDIIPDMGNVTVAKKDEGVSWGALYWQYFEQLDKITFAETPLKLKKKLFLQTNTSSGPVITPIEGNTELKIGDLVKVRIELEVDRDMEYVQMKDMRASCFEPTNVISQYKYQDALGYYESTRDASTNFFFGWLPKGSYVFEYPLRITNTGDFSNGITSIQCMYAPEFTSHSEGVRVTVK